ncbi:MAG: ChrR family anti-sigma-E factor [Alphaproteobacteria bacterium]
MIRHHPDGDLLIDYATGALREPAAVLIATHLALCPACRAVVAEIEGIGGAVLDEVAPVPIAEQALERAMARLDEPEPVPATAAAPTPSADAALLPRPLRDYVGGGLASLRWKARGGIAEAPLMQGFPGFRTRLMRIRGGTAIPRHTHVGNELTLVLAGGFSDAAGRYARGDVAAADAAVEHQPVADPGEDCLCLAVTDAPLRLTGPIGRYLNFLVRD